MKKGKDLRPNQEKNALEGAVDRYVKEAREGYFSAKLEELILRGIKFGTPFRAHPFSVNEDTRRVEKCKTRMWMFYLNVVLRFVELFVNFGSLTHHYRAGRGGAIILLGLLNFLHSLIIVLQISCVVHGNVIVQFANAAPLFYTSFACSYPLAKGEKLVEVGRAEKFVNVVFHGLNLLLAIFVSLAVLRPDLPLFLSSLLDEPFARRNLPYRFLSVMLVSYFGINMVALGNMFFGIAFGLTCPILGVIRTLRSKSHHPRVQVKMYRGMQVGEPMINDLCAPFLVPFAGSLLGIVAVYGLTSAISFEGFLSGMMGGIGGSAYTVLVIILTISCQLYENSEQLLWCWKREGRISRRSLRALRSVRLRVGSYGFVDAGMVLTVTDMIVKNAISLVIAK